MARALNVLGNVWLTLGWSVYFIGCAIILYQDGFGAMVRALSPTLVNLFSIVVILAPGIGLKVWAGKIRERA